MARIHGTGISSTTVAPLDIFVSGLNGDDANNGMTAAFPLATLIAAERLIPDIVDHRVIMHLGNAGGSPYAAPFFRERVVRARIWVIGDGAGQSGEPDGFRAVAGTGNSGTADGGSTANELIFTAGGMTVDAFLGKTIEITSGAALGDRRTITENSATTFKPTRPWSASVAGSTYRVVEPDVDIDWVRIDSDQLEVGVATGVGMDGTFRDHADLVGLFFVNIRASAPSSSVFASFRRTRILMFGVEMTDTPLSFSFNQSPASLGIDSSRDGVYSARDDFGLPSRTTWLGWTLARPLAVASPGFAYNVPKFSIVEGFIVANRTFFASITDVGFDGGRFYGDASTFQPTVDIRGFGARLTLTGRNSTLPFRVDA